VHDHLTISRNGVHLDFLGFFDVLGDDDGMVFILPPQDLDPETIKKIEIATQKIGQALNVTGPYNIQFIAKNK
jgi:hypothetical protein